MDTLLVRRGHAGLEALPGIGRGIAAAITEMVQQGRWSFLERRKGKQDPVAVLQRVPGIGPGLARRIHDALGITSLEDLEAAAHDGRLKAVSGIGPRRAQMIRSTLAGMLARPRPLAAPRGEDEPSVDQLLEIDREYRRRAEAGELPTIAPRRFNPRGEAWLPVYHTRRGKWRFTALYSNTAQAHARGKTHDWVVIYFTGPDGRERSRTVVTAARGPLAGRRVVRGREHELEE